MTQKEELEDMPLWQNHEQRITALEVTTANIKHEFTEIKDKIDQGNLEQSKKLETIDNRLMDEFFKRKNRNHENTWKLIIKVTGAVVGAGSFIYLIIEKIIGGEIKMELLNEYIVEQALIIIPVLLILGKIIKETTLIKDKFIPVTLLIIGVVLTVSMLGLNVDAVIQGILVAGAAVFGHELYKQSKELE